MLFSQGIIAKWDTIKILKTTILWVINLMSWLRTKGKLPYGFSFIIRWVCFVIFLYARRHSHARGPLLARGRSTVISQRSTPSGPPEGVGERLRTTPFLFRYPSRRIIFFDLIGAGCSGAIFWNVPDFFWRTREQNIIKNKACKDFSCNQNWTLVVRWSVLLGRSLLWAFQA